MSILLHGFREQIYERLIIQNQSYKTQLHSCIYLSICSQQNNPLKDNDRNDACWPADVKLIEANYIGLIQQQQMRVIQRLSIGNAILKVVNSQFCIYKYPYNINQEEHANYLKRVGKAEKEILEIQQNNSVPRRKRRIYDRPKHDLDITNYTAWRLYDPEEMMYKFWGHGAPVVAKLQLQPKWVIHAFGMGLLPLNHYKSASLQFSFEDYNFSKFLLYEYRNTTQFQPNDPKYNYQDQEKVPEKRRKTFRFTPEQFWKSEQYYEFRLNCTSYAQHLKFKKWVLQTVEASKLKQSYDSLIDKKYGTVLTYNKKEDTAKFVPFKPAVLSLTPNHFNLPKKGEKLKEPKVELPKKLGEEHRIKEKGEVVKGQQATASKNN